MMAPNQPPKELTEHHPRQLLVLGVSLARSRPRRPFPYSVERFRNWEGLLQAARSALPSTAVLLDPYWESGQGTVHPALGELSEVARTLPLLAAVDFHEGDPVAVRSLLCAGVADLVDLTLERTWEALLPALRAVHARPLKRRVEAGLPRWLSGNAVTLVRAAAEVVADHGGRTELARIFSVQEKTVTGWCSAEALPPPRRLLAWLRVLLGAMLLEDAGRTVSSAARCAGYSYDTNLKRAMEGFMGARTGGATREWRFDTLCAAFTRELWEKREDGRTRRRRGWRARPQSVS
jgi:hypothetical protein